MVRHQPASSIDRIGSHEEGLNSEPARHDIFLDIVSHHYALIGPAVDPSERLAVVVEIRFAEVHLFIAGDQQEVSGIETYPTKPSLNGRKREDRVSCAD